MDATKFKVRTGSDGSRGNSRHLVSVEGGTYVFREGDLGTEMYVIQTGQVEVLHAVDGQPQQLAVLEKGDFFGDMAVLDDLPRSASVRALGRLTLVRVDRSAFVSMLRENPEIAIRIMRKLSRRLREADRTIKILQGESLESAISPKTTRRAEERVELGPCRLTHGDSGASFLLAVDKASTIGRRDPVTGIRPDLDMTPIDRDRTISRQHARMYPHGEKFYIVEDIGATNGTYVNGSRIQPGVPVELKTGDAIRFGIVECEFELDPSAGRSNLS